MNQSESIANIALALVQAQGHFPTIGKDASNPEFRSAYATLDKIIETVRPILAANGLALVQGAEPNGTQLVVVTRLIHKSGEWIESSIVMPMVGRMLKGGARGELDPQSAGSAVSYGRRYGVCALLSLVTGEDDDGNATRAPAKAQRAPQAQVPASPPEKKSELFFGMPRGTPLGEYGDAALIDIINDCKTREQTAKVKQTIETARAILADRSLGQPVTDAERDAVSVSRLADKKDDLPF